MLTKLKMNYWFNELRTLVKFGKYRPMNCVPHGHFYSPIVSKNEIDSREDQL